MADVSPSAQAQAYRDVSAALIEGFDRLATRFADELEEKSPALWELCGSGHNAERLTRLRVAIVTAQMAHVTAWARRFPDRSVGELLAETLSVKLTEWLIGVQRPRPDWLSFQVDVSAKALDGLAISSLPTLAAQFRFLLGTAPLAHVIERPVEKSDMEWALHLGSLIDEGSSGVWEGVQARAERAVAARRGPGCASLAVALLGGAVLMVLI